MLKYFVVFFFGAITLQFNDDLLEECLNRLILKNVSENETILFVNTYVGNVSQLKMYYNINEEFNSIITTPKPDVYIISDNIPQSLNLINKKNVFDNKRKFIFVVEKLDQKLLDHIKRYFVWKIAFVITTNDKPEFPNKQYTVILLNNCLANNQLNIFNGTYIDNTNELKLMYTESRPYSMNSNEGIITEILNLVLTNMKIRFTYTMSTLPENSMILPPEMKSRTYDIYASFVPNKYGNTRFFEFSAPILDDDSVLVSPNIKTYHLLKLFYTEFKPKVWCVFIVTLFAVYLVFYAIINLLPSRNFSKLMLILSVIFEGVTSVSNSSRSFKILLVNYLLFGLIITNVYKSKMFDVMRSDFSYESVKDRDDIMKNKLKIGVNSEQVLRSFENWFSSDTNLTGENLAYVCKEYNDCIDRTLSQKDVVTMSLVRILKYNFSIFLDENKNPLVHFLPSMSMQSFMPICFLKGHPLFHKVNKKLLIAKESGFIENLYQKYSRNFDKIVDLRKDKISKASQLTMNSLKSTFGLYLVCVMFSLIVFTLELIIYKIKYAYTKIK